MQDNSSLTNLSNSNIEGIKFIPKNINILNDKSIQEKSLKEGDFTKNVIKINISKYTFLIFF